MEKLTGVHQKRATKRAKSQKSPIKVVYISSPMKVKASASQFRRLVQELTGRDSDPHKFYSDMGGAHDQLKMEEIRVATDEQAVGIITNRAVPALLDFEWEPEMGVCPPFGIFKDHDVFASQMMESFDGFLSSSATSPSSSSSLLYEYEPQMDLFRTLDFSV